MKQILDNIEAEQVFFRDEPTRNQTASARAFEEDDIPTDRIAQDGGAFEGLADEPDLYSLNDLKTHRRDRDDTES